MPNDALQINIFVDADLAVIHGYKDPKDPTSVHQSRTGEVICIAILARGCCHSFLNFILLFSMLLLC
jgi:hypothetical protein